MNQRPETKPEKVCAATEGMLPGTCTPMVFPFIAMQEANAPRYDADDALRNGTLFPGLNLPFHLAIPGSKVPGNSRTDLQALCFVVAELGLYLDTHPDDAEAFALFKQFSKMAKDAKVDVEKANGPLTQKNTADFDKYCWLKDPWPWNFERNEVK